VRVKNLEITQKREISEQIGKVMMDSKPRNVTLVKNSHMIEEHYEDFFNFNILYSVMKRAKLPKIL
jgi:hypothetical protein